MFDRNINILVVDDFSTMRRIVKNLLKDLGYTKIDEAPDGEPAIKMAKTGKYDLILSDWNMPGVTGIEFLKAVRADPAIKNTPFVLITAEQKRHQILEAAQSGVDNYIVKPFTAGTLQERLLKVYQRKKAEGLIK